MKLDDELLLRLARVLERAESLLPASAEQVDWRKVQACRWEAAGFGPGRLRAISRLDPIRLEDLWFLDRQREALAENTRQFLAGLPANHALLWGGKGTGKSSLVKALLNAHADQGLRLLELDKGDLANLPVILEALPSAPWRFLLFCDDLSFEQGESGYKELKSLLDGSVGMAPDNVLIYATSNRRHLLPEYLSENQASQVVDDELHHGEAVEEKISLSERFGLWLSFHPFNQNQYLRIVDHWCEQFGMAGDDDAHRQAVRWALARGSRSGRVAMQFARHWAGSRLLGR